MLEPSAQAPLSWEVFDTEAAIREQVLAVAPDVVMLQELPAMVPFVETHDMIRANPRSHSGNLATLVTHQLASTSPSFTTVEGCALLTTFSDPTITIANVHLAPGAGGAGQRLDQLAQIVEASPTEALVVVGDTNTRVAEADALVEAGMSTTKPPRPTWDSRRNRFRDAAPEFSAYFTRWFASPGVDVSEVWVWHEPLERLDRRFHISDHYAMSGVITVDGG
jgi:endonuclease/exonuclease/phosphatase family metal-dependent hydrolase